MRFMVGQDPRDDLISEGFVSADTPFGPALESFLEGCNTGKQKYGINGGIIQTSQRAALKKEMYMCVHFMLEQLKERFPEEDMRVYKLIRVVDPRLRRRPELSGMLHSECVKMLLHYFEIPLFGFVDASEVLRGHSAYMFSVDVADLVKECFVLDKNGDHDESQIYKFYYELYNSGKFSEWVKFALFCLIMATGNAISERGFSAMSAAHTKSRSELGIKHVLGAMLAQFNGASYNAFFKDIENQSKKEGKKWWGYVDKAVSLSATATAIN